MAFQNSSEDRKAFQNTRTVPSHIAIAVQYYSITLYSLSLPFASLQNPTSLPIPPHQLAITLPYLEVSTAVILALTRSQATPNNTTHHHKTRKVDRWIDR